MLSDGNDHEITKVMEDSNACFRMKMSHEIEIFVRRIRRLRDILMKYERGGAFTFYAEHCCEIAQLSHTDRQ